MCDASPGTASGNLGLLHLLSTRINSLVLVQARLQVAHVRLREVRVLRGDETQQAPRNLEWGHRRENLVVCGPSGTGKTFLPKALG